jgi:hypothetical protein
MSLFCPAFWCLDSNIYSLFSTFASRPASLPASIKDSVFFLYSSPPIISQAAYILNVSRVIKINCLLSRPTQTFIFR